MRRVLDALSYSYLKKRRQTGSKEQIGAGLGIIRDRYGGSHDHRR